MLKGEEVGPGVCEEVHFALIVPTEKSRRCLCIWSYLFVIGFICTYPHFFVEPCPWRLIFQLRLKYGSI